MSDAHEVKEVLLKVLLNIEIPNNFWASIAMSSELYGLNKHTGKWELTDKGRAWLDEQQRS